MPFRFFTLFSLLLFLTAGFTFLVSQESLKQFSAQKAAQWKTERQTAESIAVAQNMPIRVLRDDGTILEIQKIKDNRAFYYKTDNLNSAKTISVNRVWPGGTSGLNLSGSGVTLGEWDGGGVRTTHQELSGRVLQSQGSLSSHSTHVAGTMIATGISANAKGMAYQASVKAYDWNSDVSEMADAAANGLRTSNHSYGLITGWEFDYRGDGLWAWFGDTSINQLEDYSFGRYDTEAQDWDLVANNAPNYLILKSAGNDRGDGPNGSVQHWIFTVQWRLVTRARDKDGGASGYDCISSAGLAKNVVTVGSVSDITSGYSSPSGVVIASYSGWGPTDDGRIKPDVVANGQSLFSTLESSNTAYGTYSGTSMATPSVTGSIGLLLEQQAKMHGTTPLRSSTLKGIIINTADEAGLNNGPDYQFGWGLVNTLKAAHLMRLDSLDGYGTHIQEQIISQDSVLEIRFASDGTQPLQGTICWIDPAGTPQPIALDDSTSMLVNDLDMRIVRTLDSTVYSPWRLNPASPSSAATTGDNFRDNIEQIGITNPSKGSYRLFVSHKGTLSGGSQNVSIIISGNTHLGAYAAYPVDTVKLTMIPNDSALFTFNVFNNGDSLLSYNADVQPTPWLTLSNDSNDVSFADSALINLHVNTTGLSQWTTYTTSFTIQTNDPANPSTIIPVILSLQGPLFSSEPASIDVEAETTDIKQDTLVLFNHGAIPLDFWISTSPVAVKATASSVPEWLSISQDSGTIAVGGSLPIVLTFDATNQAIGDYSTSLVIASNDSLTGTVTIPVDFHVATHTYRSVSVVPRWNLVSLPLRASSTAKDDIFPDAISEAYYFNGGYFSQSTLQLGRGYWLKFDSSQSYDVYGFLALEDSFTVTTDWNLIGCISNPIPVASITSNPPGMVTSEFYGYQDGYQIVDTLIPGQGYWVKVNESGKLYLSSSSTFSSATIRIVPMHQLPPPAPGEPDNNTTLIPTEFALEQNYPNPFNPTTVIRYQLSEPAYVTLNVYNTLGEEVARLVDEMQDAGYKMQTWDANGAPSGVYFYKLTVVGQDGILSYNDTKKMLLMR